MDADAFAQHAIFAVVSGGMNAIIAERIYLRCMAALNASASATSVFKHPGKSLAIDHIWSERQRYYQCYLEASNRLTFLGTLPWIGPVLALHLAKLLGHDVAKPDVHLERLARRERTTTAKLCRRLSGQTGYRVATIDSILWRACADGLLHSQVYEREGWSAAIAPQVTREAWSPIKAAAIAIGPVPAEPDASPAA